MAVVVIRQTESLVVDFGGELEGVVEGEGGGEEGGGAVGGIGIGEGGGAGVVDEAGDVFVAVVEVVEGGTGGVAENEGTRGDGFGGIPDVGVVKGVFGAPELLDAEVVAVDETKAMVMTVSPCVQRMNRFSALYRTDQMPVSVLMRV